MPTQQQIEEARAYIMGRRELLRHLDDQDRFFRWQDATVLGLRKVGARRLAERLGVIDPVQVAPVGVPEREALPLWAYAAAECDRILVGALKDLTLDPESILRDVVESRAGAPPPRREVPEPRSDKIFLVHGRDEGRLQEVARFLEKLGIRPVILKELANRGARTLIEKFEEEASAASYAIVLLTPDDLGCLAGEAPAGLQPRARQNVILELGFFFARLGRKNVCAIHTGDIEVPSDYNGVAYTTAKGDWRLQVGRELKAAGFGIDLNRLA